MDLLSSVLLAGCNSYRWTAGIETDARPTVRPVRSEMTLSRFRPRWRCAGLEKRTSRTPSELSLYLYRQSNEPQSIGDVSNMNAFYAGFQCQVISDIFITLSECLDHHAGQSRHLRLQMLLLGPHLKRGNNGCTRTAFHVESSGRVRSV